MSVKWDQGRKKYLYTIDEALDADECRWLGELVGPADVMGRELLEAADEIDELTAENA